MTDPSISLLARLWRVVLLVLLAPVLVPLFVVALVGWLAVAVLLHLVIWVWWRPQGRDVLIVYSDSPLWRDYFEQRILPRVAARAAVLNWSQRKQWPLSLARLAFGRFGGRREFNPLVLVFRPFRRTRRFRFWQPFQEAKHGRPEALAALENELWDCLGMSPPQPPA